MNQQGSILLFILLLPTLLLATAVSLKVVLHIYEVKKTLHICRTSALAIQKKQKQLLQRLLKLNPQAKTLRIQLQITKAAYIAALALQRYDVALAFQQKINALQLKQTQLDLKQKSLLYDSQQNFYFQGIDARRKMSLSTTQDVRTHSPLQLAVTRMQPGLAPEYAPLPHFAQAQSFGLDWALHFTQTNLLLPIVQTHQTLNMSCRATITQREGQWSAHLLKSP